MAAEVPTAIAAPTIQPSIATADSKTAPTPPVATTAATIKAPTATPARNVNSPPPFLYRHFANKCVRDFFVINI